MAAKSKKPARNQETRAHRLLTNVVATEQFDRAELARELVVTGRTLDAFVAGRVAIPLDRQLLLALLVIERVPSLARQGHQLKGQVAGALAFQQRKEQHPQWNDGAPSVRLSVETRTEPSASDGAVASRARLGL